LRLTPEERRTLGEELETLTDREREVALAICDGGSNEVVAERMYIALPTLRTHLMRINQKLGTRSKGDVVRLMVGRLLDGYRAGRIGGGASASPSSPSQTTSNGRSATLAETKPLPMTDRAPPSDFHGEALGNGESAARPGLARPKIIGIDDDNRAEAARMAGSL
jgi:DNA-binding CsgD family transcriptional regulator